MDASLYFANIGQLKDLFRKLEKRSKINLIGVILDFSNIPQVINKLQIIINLQKKIDASALQILIENIEEWRNRKIIVCFVKLRPETKSQFFKAGLIDLVGPEHFFAKTSDAFDTICGKKDIQYSSYVF